MFFVHFTFPNFEKLALRHWIFLKNMIFTGYLKIFHEMGESQFNSFPTAIVFYLAILVRVGINTFISKSLSEPLTFPLDYIIRPNTRSKGSRWTFQRLSVPGDTLISRRVMSPHALASSARAAAIERACQNWILTLNRLLILQEKVISSFNLCSLAINKAGLWLIYFRWFLLP